MTTKKEATRLRLLDAGMQLAVGKGALPHIDIRLTEVLADVGLTTGAAYNIWGSQDEFRTDLAVEVAGSFADRKLVEDAEKAQKDAMSTSLGSYVDELASSMVAHNGDDMAFFLPLRFWGVRSAPEPIVERIRVGYERSDAAFVAIINDICERFGLAIGNGRTVEEVALMAVACLDGVLIRNRFADAKGDGANSCACVLADMFRSILKLSLVPADGSQNFDIWDEQEDLSQTALAS